MIINDRVFCIALLEGSKLYEAIKTNNENIARNKGRGGTEVRMDPIVMDQALRRFTVIENEASIILFNQNNSRGYQMMGNKDQNQRGRGEYRSAKGRFGQQRAFFRCGSNNCENVKPIMK